MPTYQATLVGASFRGGDVKQHIRQELAIGSLLELERDHHNQYDENAVRVIHEGVFLGFVEKDVAAVIAPLLDHGAAVEEVRILSFLSEIKPHLEISIGDSPTA